MRIALELRGIQEILTAAKVQSLITACDSSPRLSAASAIVRFPLRHPGELASVDPSTLQLILEVANAGAIGLALKGFFGIIIEWQKGRTRSLVIKIGEVSVELPATQSKEEILQLMERVAEIARELTVPQTPSPQEKAGGRKQHSKR